MSGLKKLIQEIYVQPGESHLVAQPAVLRTVLGSCVGVTFLVPRLGVAALCHPMLPRCPPGQAEIISLTGGRRYVDFAVRDMARQFDALGVARSEAVVKLFGGNDVLTVIEGNLRPTIGKLNAEAALHILAEEGFAVAASCLGGNRGIHISFDTMTGGVLLRRLDSSLPHRTRRSARTAHGSGQRR
jgi:chemotaxis protein CheD